MGEIMNNVRSMLGINKIHDAGIKGKGITIAILDTGIIAHKDLKGRIVNFNDVIGNRKEIYDDNGHGTHIAGICAGNGEASRGKYKGICPEAQILAVKVLDDKGRGKEEDVVKAAEWIIDNKVNFGINIVNISFGTIECENKDEITPMIVAVEKMWDSGLVVVAAAGNNGPEEGSITSPGISKKIITVGALDDYRKVNINGKYVNNYSGVGFSKDKEIKPEVIAPATMIRSCGINKGTVSYTEKSGTSMAAPIVSGCIGLLLNKYPGVRNQDIKIMLKSTCKDRGMPHNRQGYGLIDPVNLLKL